MSAPIDQSTSVREGEQLDAARLGEFLAAHISGVQLPLVVEQFPQGFSNLTYLVRAGDQEFVLRRPPFGNRVKSAHDMGREYNVLSKLHKVYELAPKPLAYTDDESVLGAPFYVMERRRGVILRKSLPRGTNVEPETLRTLGLNAIDNLARLHTLDYAAAGLADLGKPSGYVERQVSGWASRYEKAQTDDVPAMFATIEWLKQNQPAESGAALIHNDYKYDNLILDPNDLTRIIAVLDWEMCTIGDPLMDLGATLAYWVEEGDDASLTSFVAGPTNLPGSPKRSELIDRYREQTGRDLSNILFYYCFGLFKLAVIIQQIYYRYAAGHTQDPRFAHLNKVVFNLGRAAVRAIEIGRVS
ncbi:MAG: phosphotransferase family protein [Planctomycetaceae bacterium]